MATLLYGLGRLSARRPWALVGTWVVLVAVVAGAFVTAGGTLAAGVSIPATETEQVSDRLVQELPDAGGASGPVVFSRDDGAPLDEQQRAEISALLEDVRDLDGVRDVVDPFQVAAAREAREAELAAAVEAGAPPAQVEPGQRLLDLSAGLRTVSEDGSAAIGVVRLVEEHTTVPVEVRAGLGDALLGADIDGVSVEMSAVLVGQVGGLLGVGEVVGLLVAAVVLAVVLRGLLPATLPLVSSLVGVAVGVVGSLAFSDVVTMTASTPVLGVMLGLAVGIDYSLFILTRHRRQLLEGTGLRESIALATATSGTAVVVAGSTVIIALLALNLSGVPFLGVMGTVAAACVLVAVLVAVSLTPPLLRLAGRRVLTRRERARAEAAATSAAPAAAPVRTQRTPVAVVTLVVATLALLVVAVPALSMRLAWPAGSSEAEDSTMYRAYTAVAESFSEGQNGPLVVGATLPDAVTEAALLTVQADIAQQLAEREHVVAVAPIGVSDDLDYLAFQVVPQEGPSSGSTEQLVQDLRAASPLPGGTEIGVAGQTSANIDVSERLTDALPTYLAVVVGLSMVILVVVLRSLLLPLVATAGFVLSLGAALGATTAVYQWGWLGSVFAVHEPGPVLNFAPIIITGVVFGLAMDYQLFLVAGMRESYAHGTPAREAVVVGLRQSRAVIIAAAVIMVAVFGGFVFSHLSTIRPLGFGMAVGVLVDAFVVRLLMVPAVMHLLGDRAWWLPGWLDRVLPDVDIEGAGLQRSPAPAPPTSTDVREPAGV